MPSVLWLQAVHEMYRLHFMKMALLSDKDVDFFQLCFKFF